jgi:hypothetical protein
MSVDLTGFDANEIEPNVPFEPIPPGWYKAIIIDSEEVPTRAQTGSFVKLTFEIIEGEFSRRKLWTMLNLNNPSEEAVKIARRDLSSICHAVNIMRPHESTDLHDIPLMLKVRVKDAEGQFDASNKIVGYANIKANLAHLDSSDKQENVRVTPAIAAKATASKAAAGKTPPWRK